jgi:hypothetical protein
LSVEFLVALYQILFILIFTFSLGESEMRKHCYNYVQPCIGNNFLAFRDLSGLCFLGRPKKYDRWIVIAARDFVKLKKYMENGL